MKVEIPAEARKLFARLRRAAPRERDDLAASVPTQWRTCIDTLRGGPEPSSALLRAEQLHEAILAAGPLSVALCQLLHQGGYPARMLQLCPEARNVLQDDRPPPRLSIEELTAAALRDLEQHGPSEGLGRVRTRAYLWLARREVEGAPLEEVGVGLCDVAAACTHAALRYVGLEHRVAVFGMGKLGGRELNFLSDIDLLFVHHDGNGDPDAERRRVLDLHERLRKVVRMLEGEGRFRPLFRVDLRLRPFGARGPLSMSLSATESYYERHGRDWERQAWLRARPIAGDLALGQILLHRLTPFIYRRSVTEAIFEEIGALMRRARRDGRIAIGPGDAIDLKLDAGGIREVEFSVQALQLLHGGKNPALRAPTTLEGLDRLLAAGLISDREHRELHSAYRFLRRVEHRLQLIEGQQTHRVPGDPEARTLLAARLAVGGRGPTEPTTLAAFDQALQEHRDHVSAVARTIGGPQPDSALHDERERDRAVALDLAAPIEVRQQALANLGVRDAGEAEALLQHLGSREDGAFAARGPTRQGAENLLLACLDAADPDAALARLVEFASLRPAHYGVWRFFAEPATVGHDLLRLSAELFGTSEALSRGLIGFPAHSGRLRDESIGLLQGAMTTALPGPPEIAAALEELGTEGRGIDATLLRLKHQQLVSIALHDLGGRPDPLHVGAALSDLADLVIRVLLRDLAAEAARDRRAAAGLRIAVLALGKYGERVMDYGSDLDLMLVFDAEGIAAEVRSHQPEAIRLGQRLISRLQNRTMGMRLYEVDMRLRPSGRQGLLVSPLGGFRRYHASDLPVWERLALLRLRPVGEITIGPTLVAPGPAARAEPLGAQVAAALPGPLCREVLAVVGRTLRSEATPLQADDVARAVRQLKARIEHEVARESRAAGPFNAKSGYGGLLELELLVGALVLLHAPQRAALWHASLPEAIHLLAQAQIFTEEESCALGAAHRFLRIFLNRLRMTHAGGIDDLDRFAQNSPRLMTLARRMGLPSRDSLLEQFHEARAVVRTAFDRHL